MATATKTEEVVYRGEREVLPGQDANDRMILGEPRVDLIRAHGVGPEGLPLRLDLANHSPSGFEWGYGGSGPSQLALAILAHATGDDLVALVLYHDFRDEYTSRFPHSRWVMTRDEVCGWVFAQKRDRAEVYAQRLRMVQLGRGIDPETGKPFPTGDEE